MSGCSNNTPSVDSRCADPAFRAANPQLCKNFQQLILQPENAVAEPGGTVEYKVILRANGKEIELDRGLEWASSNQGAATIGPDGVATGVTAGVASISVSWQNLTANGQLTVVGSCEDTNQNFLVLIDNSKSMGQGFSGLYSTKLAFSKAIAAGFADTINYSKDQISVAKFSDSFEELQAWGTDAAAAKSKINSITTSTGKTNLAVGLQYAIDSLNDQSGAKIVVLFTDGEWSGDDPKPIARAFKEAGGFIAVVATHAWGDFFVDLLDIASDGFLLSAYPATEANILNALSGLKSFLCSGSCSPDAGTAPHAQLNYDGFINWNVTAGRVDLVGLGLWDVQPGNGLYVDLQGTADNGAGLGDDFGLGQITSKEEYEFLDGQDYSFQLNVGGSTGRVAGTWTIRVRVGNQIDELITITQGNQPFSPRLFEWTQSGDFTGPIIIEQTEQSGHHNVGTLIDEVLLQNVTDDEVMLYDNFDGENPTTIPADPGYGYGCLRTPPGTQQASPTPPTPRVTE